MPLSYSSFIFPNRCCNITIIYLPSLFRFYFWTFIGLSWRWKLTVCSLFQVSVVLTSLHCHDYYLPFWRVINNARNVTFKYLYSPRVKSWSRETILLCQSTIFQNIFVEISNLAVKKSQFLRFIAPLFNKFWLAFIQLYPSVTLQWKAFLGMYLDLSFTKVASVCGKN